MDNTCCESNCQKHGLKLPGKKLYIYPNNVVILQRFSTVRWRVHFGWFSYEGNRKICGWYLQRIDHPHDIKPIQESDLSDIYVVEY